VIPHLIGRSAASVGPAGSEPAVGRFSSIAMSGIAMSGIAMSGMRKAPPVRDDGRCRAQVSRHGTAFRPCHARGQFVQGGILACGQVSKKRLRIDVHVDPWPVWHVCSCQPRTQATYAGRAQAQRHRDLAPCLQQQPTSVRPAQHAKRILPLVNRISAPNRRN